MHITYFSALVSSWLLSFIIDSTYDTQNILECIRWCTTGFKTRSEVVVYYTKALGAHALARKEPRSEWLFAVSYPRNILFCLV